MNHSSRARSLPLIPLLGVAVVGASLLWSYWPTWESMAHEWKRNPVYSHGYLVPAFALILLWSRRHKLKEQTLQPNWPAGCSLLLLAAVIRLAGAYFFYPWLDTVSLLPCLAGLSLLLAGWPGLVWSWPAIAFLLFMVPLPYSLETGMKQPLQRLATQGSTYAMQTLGCPAFAEGNVILLRNRPPLGVEEACSGLSMLLVFFALATAVALMVRRPLWEKGLILLSAAPIAVFANVGRITLTGFLYQWGRSREAELVFHDLAGWLMMPAGLIMIGTELTILNRLMIVPKPRQPLPLNFARSVGQPALVPKKDLDNRRQRPRKAGLPSTVA